MPSLIKFALPALFAAGAVSAQCSNSATSTIQNSGDASAIGSSCPTYSGSIAVATGTTDDLSFDGLKKLSGNFVVNGAEQVKRISAGDLEQLSGEMNLKGLVRLSALSFPKLKSVDSIKWNALPNLHDTGFTAEVETAKKLDIQNTGLSSLAGINIDAVDTIFIANNAYINEINMQLDHVNTALTLADNNENVKVSFPNLQWAFNLTFRFCSSVDLPSLQSLNGSLGLYNNGFDSFSAPNLTEVGQALAIVANNKLTNLTFPSLTKISDDLGIANNSALTEVTGFPELLTIGGAFDMSGNMSDVETPKITRIEGAFNLQSTDNVTASCAFYQPLKSSKKIRGSFFCRGKVVDPGTQGHKPTDQGGKKSSAVSTGVNVALALAAMGAVLLL